MLGGYVTVTLMNQFGLAVPGHPADRLHRGGGGQRGVRAHAVPAALPRERSRPVPAHHRARVRLGRGRGLRLRHRSSSRCSCRAICAARCKSAALTLRRLPHLPDRGRARRHRALLVAGARIHPLRRAGARRGRQPAHGARARHQRRRARSRSPSRSAAGLPASAARSPSRSSASIRPSRSPIWSTC